MYVRKVRMRSVKKATCIIVPKQIALTFKAKYLSCNRKEKQVSNTKSREVEEKKKTFQQRKKRRKKERERVHNIHTRNRIRSKASSYLFCLFASSTSMSTWHCNSRRRAQNKTKRKENATVNNNCSLLCTLRALQKQKRKSGCGQRSDRGGKKKG